MSDVKRWLSAEISSTLNLGEFLNLIEQIDYEARHLSVLLLLYLASSFFQIACILFEAPSIAEIPLADE